MDRLHREMLLPEREALLVVGGLGTPAGYFQPLVDLLPPGVDFFFHDFSLARGGSAKEDDVEEHGPAVRCRVCSLVAAYGPRRVTVLAFSLSCYATAAALRHLPVKLVAVDPPATTLATNAGARALFGLPAWACRLWDAAPRPLRFAALQLHALLRTPACVDWAIAGHRVEDLRDALRRYLLRPYGDKQHLEALAVNRRGVPGLVLVAADGPYFSAAAEEAIAGREQTTMAMDELPSSVSCRVAQHDVRTVHGTHHVIRQRPHLIAAELRRYAWPRWWSPPPSSSSSALAAALAPPLCACQRRRETGSEPGAPASLPSPSHDRGQLRRWETLGHVCIEMAPLLSAP